MPNIFDGGRGTNPKPPKPKPPIWETWGQEASPGVPPLIMAPWYNRHTRPSTRGLGRKAIPYIPGKGFGKDPNKKGGETGGTDEVKVVNPSNFIENISTTQPDYAAESLVAFNNLTTIEILEISRSGNIDVDARNLNPNILDIVDVVNTFSPTEIIKLQTTLDTFFSPFEENLAENSFDITTIPGIAEIKIPQKNDNNLSKTQIQVLAPKKIQRDTIYI